MALRRLGCLAAIPILAGCSPSPGVHGAASSAAAPAVAEPRPAADQIPPGSQGQPYARSRSYTRVAGSQPTIAQVWFICDGIPGRRITVVDLPDQQRRLSLTPVLKDQAEKPEPLAYFRLGEPDPGAGQVYWPLDDGHGTTGNLHAFNPGALPAPADAFTPTFTSIRTAGADTTCRWVARTRLFAVSGRRSFLVTQTAAGGLEYRTFDFEDAAAAKAVAPDGAQRSSEPSLDIKGGRETAAGFTFANKSYAYELAAGAGGGAVTIIRHGERIATEDLQAWTIAPRP